MKIVLIVLLLSGAALAQTSVHETDDAGHALKLAHPARRVISLAPSLTELVYEAGGGDYLVGTVDYSDYPSAALKLPRIGSNQKLDVERIAGLKPDLIVVWFHGNALREVEQLAALGIPSFYVEPHHIEDIPGALEPKRLHRQPPSDFARAMPSFARATQVAVRSGSSIRSRPIRC
jgi:iron complex transport system substrate-binding protein